MKILLDFKLTVSSLAQYFFLFAHTPGHRVYSRKRQDLHSTGTNYIVHCYDRGREIEIMRH